MFKQHCSMQNWHEDESVESENEKNSGLTGVLTVN